MDLEKENEYLRKENKRLTREISELEQSLNSLFKATENHFEQLETESLSDKIKFLSIIFKSLESRESNLTSQLKALNEVEDGISIFTKSGNLNYCNKSFFKIFGIELKDLRGKNWKSILPENSIEPIKEFLKEISLSYPIHKQIVITQNNIKRFYSASAFPLKNESFLFKIKDVTAEKNKLQKIHEQTLLLESAKELMAICSENFEFEFINSSGKKLLEISDENNHLFTDYIKDNQHFITKIIPQIIKKEGWIGELNIETSNRLFPVNCEITPFQSATNGENGFYIVLRDITEKKEAIKKLVDAKNEAEDNMKSRQQFLAKMSHEIRTPMNAIIGLTSLLQDSRLTSKQKEYTNSIKLSADNLLVIINDILDLTKVESGNLSIEKVRFDFKELISGLNSVFKHKIEKNGVDFVIDIDDEIPQYLLGDPTRLNQILLNLISNAEKFTSQGSIQLKVKLISNTKENCNLRFEVIDTGIGIAKENLNKIFDAFAQESDSTSRLYGGTGLGLTIVHQLVQLQNGKIWVESKLHKGSKFFVELSYKNSGKPEPVKSPFNENFNISKLKSARIIMAEDYPMNRLLAKSLFEKWNLHLTLVKNGKELLNDLNTNNYDIILMDIQMPEIDGLEATRKLRKRGIKTPVIAITAHAFKEEQEECTKAGMNDFISKPFNENELREKLITYLNLKHGDLNTIPSPNTTEENPNSNLNYFSLDYIKDMGAGDESFIDEMLNMFLNQVPLLLNNMIKAINDGDQVTLAQNAHKVQPSFVMVNRKDMQTDLKAIELWAKGKQELNNPVGELSSVIEKAKLIIASISDYLGKAFIFEFDDIKVLLNTKELKDLTVNFDRLEEVSEGNEAFEKEMIELFLDQTNKQIEEISSLKTSKKYKDAAIIFHNMIASFDLIGCETLISYSRRLEENCNKPQETSNLDKLIEDFIAVTKKSLQIVKSKAKTRGIL